MVRRGDTRYRFNRVLELQPLIEMMMRAAIKTALLGAAACLTVVSGALAQAAPMHLSLEGGLACSRNKNFFPDLGVSIGDEGCGGTGAVEIGRTGAPVWGVFDHWALRGRFTAFDDDVRDGVAVATMKDKRLVLDAEIGTKFNLVSFFGGTSRLVVGLRYASWRGNLDATDGVNTAALDLDSNVFGPRIGLRSSIPLGESWMLQSRSGLAALYGTHKGVSYDNGVIDGSATSRTWTYSVESNTALTYKMDGTETGRLISLGLFSEYWFNQVEFVDFKRHRHSWGPFLRVSVPLAQ